MKKEWYIYEMKEVLSPTGKPYVGSTCNLYNRTAKHKHIHRFNKTPELIVIDGPYFTRKEARTVEQPYRVANGWPHENEQLYKNGKKNGKNQGKKNAENRIGVCNFQSQSKGGKGKIWINDGNINKRILPEHLDEWSQKGFIKGNIQKKIKNK